MDSQEVFICMGVGGDIDVSSADSYGGNLETYKDQRKL